MKSIVSNIKYKHIFVSGPPRSGTTLLQLVLSAHHMVTISPETLFIQQLFDKKYLPTKRLTKEEIKSIIYTMEIDNKLNTWPKFRLNSFLEENPLRQGMTVSEILDRLFLYYANILSGRLYYLGNKKGLFADGYGPYTKTIFPDSKFIYIVRDPRDMIRSVLINLPEYSLIKAAAAYVIRCRNILKMASVYPNDTLILKYEDLVSNPGRACRTICEFLKIPFDQRMLNFYEFNRDGSGLIGLTTDMHLNTTTPFNPNLIGQWMKNDFFKPKDIQIIEGLAFKYMERFGYKFESQLSRTQSKFVRLKILVLSRYRIFRDKLSTSQAP